MDWGSMFHIDFLGRPKRRRHGNWCLRWRCLAVANLRPFRRPGLSGQSPCRLPALVRPITELTGRVVRYLTLRTMSSVTSPPYPPPQATDDKQRQKPPLPYSFSLSFFPLSSFASKHHLPAHAIGSRRKRSRTGPPSPVLSNTPAVALHVV